MSISLPVLLLIFGGLSLWLLSESAIKWHLKAACITTFCAFTLVFWTTIPSYLGWPADQDDMPEKVMIHWVIVKEPNKFTGFKGEIYFLVESATKAENSILMFFGYRGDGPEPRLFGLPYSRELHEQVESEMKGKLQKGQPVMGKFSKGNGGEGGEGKGGKKGNGKGEPSKHKGEGSDSQEQEWHFHFLRPSDYMPKPQS